MRTHDQPILTAENLRKSYGPRQALQGLSFSLKPGRILGFLGPNGAGKTTAIRILTTMMEPDAGHFTVDGISSKNSDEIRRRIGVLPENLGFPKNMTGMEYLTYFGQLYGRPISDAKETGMALLEEVGMERRARSLIGTYSHGMRQRLGIARALVNDPTVVFLDEPTLGLDPRGQQELLSLVRRIAKERSAGVVLCSHALTEVEVVCDDVVILSAGQVVAEGPVGQVVSSVRRNTCRIRVPARSMAAAQQALERMRLAMKVTPAEDGSGWLTVQIRSRLTGRSGTASGTKQPSGTDGKGASDGASKARPMPKRVYMTNTVLRGLIRADIPIQGFETEGGRLQDVFLGLTEEAIQ